jgi:hypothetical protein
MVNCKLLMRRDEKHPNHLFTMVNSRVVILNEVKNPSSIFERGFVGFDRLKDFVEATRWVMFFLKFKINSQHTRFYKCK